MKQLEREALLADREAVRTILAEIPESDPLGRLSFQSRLNAIENRLAELSQSTETRGSVALMFGGPPVIGSRAIDAGFASAVVESFQELIQKRVAAEEIGRLGSRGPVPLRTEVNLAITDIVRGSVGFVLEEATPYEDIADTAVKNAIDDVARVVVSTGAENEEEFERVIEALDHRLLVALRKFFKTLDETQATLRIVESERDAQLDTKAVHRGRLRVDAIEIKDEESEQVIGELLGILPASKRFEMRLRETGETIKGIVAANVAPTYLHSIELPGETPIVGRTWRAKMRIREIRERNKPSRRLYTLLGLIELADPTKLK